VRSVIDAIPIGTSGSVARRRSARRLARARPGRPPGACGRLHRKRRVEDEERLRVRPLVDELRPDDDGLRGSHRDEGREQHERDSDRQDSANARVRKGESAADPARRPLGQDKRGERQSDREREQRVERRQERQPSHQYPLPMGDRAAPPAEAVPAARVLVERAEAGTPDAKHELEVLLRVVASRVQLGRLLEVSRGPLQDCFQCAVVVSRRRGRHDENAEQVRRERPLPRTLPAGGDVLEPLLCLGPQGWQVLMGFRRRADPAVPEELERAPVRHRVTRAEKQACGIPGQQRRRLPEAVVRRQGAEAEIVACDGRPPRAHVGREEYENDRDGRAKAVRGAPSDGDEGDGVDASCHRPLDLEPAVPALVAREQGDEKGAQQEQRPWRRRSDRLSVSLGGVREHARIDHDILAEERLEEVDVDGCGEQRHDSERRCVRREDAVPRR